MTLKILVVVPTVNKVSGVELPTATLPVVLATYNVGMVEVPKYAPPQTSRVSRGVVVAMPIFPSVVTIKLSEPTFNFPDGLAVPIPILPAEVITNAGEVLPTVNNPVGLEVAMPTPE